MLEAVPRAAAEQPPRVALGMLREEEVGVAGQLVLADARADDRCVGERREPLRGVRARAPARAPAAAGGRGGRGRSPRRGRPARPSRRARRARRGRRTARRSRRSRACRCHEPSVPKKKTSRREIRSSTCSGKSFGSHAPQAQTTTSARGGVGGGRRRASRAGRRAGSPSSTSSCVARRACSTPESGSYSTPLQVVDAERRVEAARVVRRQPLARDAGRLERRRGSAASKPSSRLGEPRDADRLPDLRAGLLLQLEPERPRRAGRGACTTRRRRVRRARGACRRPSPTGPCRARTARRASRRGRGARARAPSRRRRRRRRPP